MSCDDTGRRPVLSCRLGWVMKGQSRLFDWQAGDPSLWYVVTQYLEQRRHKGLLQRRLHWDEGVAKSRGRLVICVQTLDRLALKI